MPVVHADAPHAVRSSERTGRMDCRVKPGNDEIESRSRDAPEHPSYDTPLSDFVTTGLDPVVHAELTPGNAACRATVDDHV